jgi:hypothetical protein
MRVKHRTSRKKLQGVCRRIKEWIRDNRHLKGKQFIQELNRRLQGITSITDSGAIANLSTVSTSGPSSVHSNGSIEGAAGEAKFLLEPQIELAQNYGLSQKELSEALRLIKEHEHDIRSAWHKHFGS